VFGGVTIAERHIKRKNEHKLIAQKVDTGAQWFISQAIYNPQPTIDVRACIRRVSLCLARAPRTVLASAHNDARLRLKAHGVCTARAD
jgi:hypothetical protein